MEQPEHALTSLLMPNKKATVLSMAEIPEAWVTGSRDIFENPILTVSILVHKVCDIN